MVCLTTVGTSSFHSLHGFVALDHLPKDNVLSIKVGCVGCADEELRAVGVWAGVRHGQGSRSEVLSGLAREGFVVETLTVDGFTTSTIAASEVTTLAHEVGDDAVEGGSLEVQRLARATNALLSSAEGTEVISSLRANVSKELELNATSILTGDIDLEEHLWVSGQNWVEGDLGTQSRAEEAQHVSLYQNKKCD